ncbi:DNA polymerase [Limnochorda pilosa]|uniref:Type-4 uracil-DNA glycosylase n=1 Tax=Limnochorda pilosa TaxID=1555112 RepID=A0A0K2SKG9_LIMPI|nr:DNA polymerase [Limnochorda pilosa]
MTRLAEEAAGCRRCPLRAGCRQVVFGEGNPHATLMLVGEGPGAQEDLEGRPFVGRAGQLLDKMLEAIGIGRSEVYIANVVKCRPPGNRVPAPAEQEACVPYLREQMELIRPELVLCLGATAARRLIDPRFSVTRDHGVWYQRDGREVMATFHPAALLRDPGKKRLAWDDLRKLQAAYLGRTG